MQAKTLLECKGVTVRFGGVVALGGVDFTVPQGAVSSIIGPNGAGKTTMFNTITGLVPINEGQIHFNGMDITRMPTHKRSKAGVVRTFQNLEVFSNMSVLENVMTGRHARTGYGAFRALLKTPRYFKEERACQRVAEEKLDFVGLHEDKNLSATELPFGKQRLLELARAIAAEPKLLILDEIAAGLNMKETRTLGKTIRRVRDELGITIALVEHDMELVMGISDEITVIQFGQRLAMGTPQEIQNNPAVVAAYLGEDEEEASTTGDRK